MTAILPWSFDNETRETQEAHKNTGASSERNFEDSVCHVKHSSEKSSARSAALLEDEGVEAICRLDIFERCSAGGQRREPGLVCLVHISLWPFPDLKRYQCQRGMAMGTERPI